MRITIRRTIRAALAAGQAIARSAVSRTFRIDRSANYRPLPAVKESTMARQTRPEFLDLPTAKLIEQRSICLRPELGEDPRMRAVLIDLADRASDEIDARRRADAMARIYE